MKAKYIALAAVAVAVGGVAFWKNGQLQAEELQGITAVNGRIELNRLDIATLYPGRVTELLVQEGEQVVLNQPLARLDAQTAQAQTAAAQAAMQQAQDAVSRAQAEMQAKAQQVKTAQVDLANAQQLRRDNLISASELTHRQAALTAAKAQVEAAQAAVAQAKSQVAQAQAQWQKAQLQEADMLIKAPKNARVEYRIAEVGNVLGSGGKVVSLLDPSDVYLNVFLTAKQSNQLKIGEEARIIVDGVDAVFPAIITFVASQAQFTPKSVETTEERAKLMFKVKLQIPENIALQQLALLKGGMTAVGYVKYDANAQWPENLAVKLPQ